MLVTQRSVGDTTRFRSFLRTKTGEAARRAAQHEGVKVMESESRRGGAHAGAPE